MLSSKSNVNKSESKCEQLSSERYEYFKANFQFQLERSQYLKDVISMYQRGLQLDSTFVHLPSHMVFDGDKKFRCGSKSSTTILPLFCGTGVNVQLLVSSMAHFLRSSSSLSFILVFYRGCSSFFPCFFRVHFVLQLWNPTWKRLGTISMLFCHHTIILMLANIPSKFIVWIMMLNTIALLTFLNFYKLRFELVPYSSSSLSFSISSSSASVSSAATSSAGQFV